MRRCWAICFWWQRNWHASADSNRRAIARSLTTARGQDKRYSTCMSTYWEAACFTGRLVKNHLWRGTAGDAMNKVFANADDAIHDIANDATLMVGGFGMCGVPVELIDAVRRKGVTGLTVISNNAGCDGFGLGLLLETGQ